MGSKILRLFGNMLCASRQVDILKSISERPVKRLAPPENGSRWIKYRLSCGVLAALFSAAATRAEAQTDFYNTDRGRPIQIEDAYATDRYAFELKIAPVRLERSQGGDYTWSVSPEIAFGILPRTHVELGMPIAYEDTRDRSTSGVRGVELTLFHNLNVETAGTPAFALRTDVLLPVGSLSASTPYASFTGVATRTVKVVRVHVNAQVTAGPDMPAFIDGLPASTARNTREISRWLAGLAVDKTFPLSALLITAEFFARQPATERRKQQFTLGTGLRYQWSQTISLDTGLGRQLNGPDQGWYITFGSAYAFGIRALLPGI